MEMATVRMDDKFRIVIPKRLRKAVNIFEKCHFQIYAFESLIWLREVDPDRDGIMEAVDRIKALEDLENVR
jgi:bifunctional DNA-binding transcriptional regulator/antitoxin component of YhaV-PrlF toxin-antitoxin module